MTADPPDDPALSPDALTSSRSEGLSLVASWLRRPGRDRFEQLLAPHVSGLYRIAFRLTREAAGAEDLLQSVLTKLFEQRAELAKVDNLRAWATRMLRNCYLDGWRHDQLGPVSETAFRQAGGAPLESIPDTALEPDAAAERLQLQERIRSVLQTLSQEHREVLIFHDIEGYTMQELEVVLGAPIGTIKSRLHRARASLREGLARRDETVLPGRPSLGV